MKLFGPDFYNITELLTEEELMIQRTAYEFVQAEFMPLVHEHYEKGTFPMELATKLGELGFMGSSLPEESGGSGVSGSTTIGSAGVTGTNKNLPTYYALCYIMKS